MGTVIKNILNPDMIGLDKNGINLNKSKSEQPVKKNEERDVIFASECNSSIKIKIPVELSI